MTTNAPTPDDAARENLRAAIQRLEIEAYQHGLRNGRPNGKYRAGHFKPKPGIPDPVGADHHAARTELERILNLAAKGISLSEPGMVAVDREALETIAEALDIMDNPYDGEEELGNWGDFIHAKDMLDVALHPNGATAEWMGLTAQDHDGEEHAHE